MDDDDELMESLNSARNRVIYGSYKNSLVEWTLSDDWVRPSQDLNPGKRGLLTSKNGNVRELNNSFSGEINL